MKNIDIITAGYPSVDRIIKTSTCPCFCQTSIVTNADNNYPYFGGCNVNIAYLASCMGLKTAIAMQVGNDFESLGFKEFLEKVNVDLSGVNIIQEDTTSSSYLITNPEGEHITLFYPGAMDQKYSFKIDEELIKNSKYGIITVGNPKYNIEFSRLCRKHKVPMILGMKCDFKSFTVEILKDIISGCEILVMNESERKELEKAFKLGDIKEFFNNGITKIIIITKGSNGSEVHHFQNRSTSCYQIPIARPDMVTDTAGVGDAYLAGFMAGYINGKNIEKCGRMGSVLSSFIIEKMGCMTNMPSMNELNSRYKSNYGEEL